MPAASRLHLKKPTATAFFTLAASRWRKIIGYEKVSTTEQKLGLQNDDLKPAFDTSVDPTEARKAAGHSHAVGGSEPGGTSPDARNGDKLTRRVER